MADQERKDNFYSLWWSKEKEVVYHRIALGSIDDMLKMLDSNLKGDLAHNNRFKYRIVQMSPKVVMVAKSFNDVEYNEEECAVCEYKDWGREY